MKLKTTFDSENGFLRLKQTGVVVSFFKELWDPLGTEDRAAASAGLSWFGHLGMCFGVLGTYSWEGRTPRGGPGTW